MTTHKKHEDIGARRAAMGISLQLHALTIALLIFYVAAGLLNGRHLWEEASRRPYGPARNFWMTVFAPWNKVSAWSHATAVRDLAEKTREIINE